MDVHPQTSFDFDFSLSPEPSQDLLNDIYGFVANTNYPKHLLQPLPANVPVVHDQDASGPSSGELLTHNISYPSKSPPSSTSSLQRALPTRGRKRAQPIKQASRKTGAKQKDTLANLQAIADQKLAQLQSLSAENDSLKSRARILERITACRDEQLYILKRWGDLDPKTCDEVEEGCTAVEVLECIPSASEVEACKNMLPEELRRFWKKFLAEASVILVKTEGGSVDTTLLGALANIVNKTGCVMAHVGLLNARALHACLSVNMESDADAVPDEQHWRSVLAAVDLSYQQKSDVAIVYQLFLKRMKTLFQERKLIKLALGSFFEDAISDAQSGRHQFDASCVTQVHQQEMLERLHESLRKERSAQLMLCCFCFGKVMTTVQFSKFAVYSYPYFPDAVAVSSIIAADFADGTIAGLASGTGDIPSFS